ncbi:MAG: CdaR family protein [Oscillospiraceae bacterium]|nr:CdaR family protein [Bacteroidales bacterium]MDD6998563.1 CdaR family protein [Oscillospiraceae bacterium]MDY5096520.1 CdaR family protein [Oscillospiraceae bacterium]
MKKNKFSLSAFLDDPRGRAALALLIAVFTWTLVTTVINPGTTQTYSGVPVDYSYGTSDYTSQGLDIVKKPDYKVRVTCTGNGSVLGGLDAADFIVYPDYSVVTGSGEVTLPLKVRMADGSLENQVKVELTDGQSSTVDVILDKVVERTFTVTTDVSDLKPASGYVLNSVSCSPSEVTIQGPETELNQISKVTAPVTMDSELSDSAVVQVDLEYTDQEGNPIQLEYAESSADRASVSFSVYQLANLPLTVDFLNAPPGFDVSKLPYTLSQQTLTVAGPSRQISTMTSLSVGYFDLSTFKLDKDWPMSIELPENIVSQENVTAVTLSFDSSNLARKVLNVSRDNIRVINLPANYQLEPENTRINNVTLIGPKDEIAGLSASNVVAQIDAQDIQVSVGKQNLTVQIYVPAASGVFAVGSYTVECNITSR